MSVRTRIVARAGQSTTSTPIERAVPASERTHASIDAAFVSWIFSCASFVSCARVILPTLSLLGRDEPLAGMGAEETERMLTLLGELKAGHAIALVEHDMDAVFRVADVITVMVNGAVLASGTPQAVRANPDVQAAYLGEHA